MKSPAVEYHSEFLYFNRFPGSASMAASTSCARALDPRRQWLDEHPFTQARARAWVRFRPAFFLTPSGVEKQSS